ncbi:ABC transporter ATP-binding protein [Buchananella hordeovulneris]|uniref:ABC transporter ATP-binding protein n=1 Tax=Buchananella hordeovulneris TaxID=52770 RepID=UPI0026DCE99D|nr:ABC transporter ATP-binding protein [Buchananella hordeovulneris]MDO5080357.1 ABC transporter ATP-binding protein [Buchananella hordeovulneris]
MALIEVSGLTKSYGTRQVLRGVELSVQAGQIVGILGANGSGKTTAIECIGGLRQRDGGQVRVAGLDPAANPPALRELLGMQLQQCRLPDKIKVREALELYAAFYPHPRPSGELLDHFGLAAQAEQRFSALSGGQQQRLSVALALIGRPRIAFLDELTTGLDPAARRDIWVYLEALRDDGVTLVLVTHFMEEAQRLCDQLFVIGDGRVIASGSPAALTGAVGGQETSFAALPQLPLAALRALPDVHEVVVARDRVVVRGGPASPQQVIGALTDVGYPLTDLRVTSPSLDDAFLALTRPEEEK